MSNCCAPTVTNFDDVIGLDSLLRHVIPEVPEVPHDMALDRIRQSYTEFARKTLLITYRQTQDYQTDVHDYFLTPPDGYEVYQVLGLESPGYRYVDYWQGGRVGLWNTKLDVIDNKVLYLHRSPSVDTENGLHIFMQVLPGRCCNTIPNSIDVPFGYGIAKGALASLQRIPGKPWTNLGISRANELEFNRIVLAGKNLAMTNRKFGGIIARGRRVV